MKRNMDLVREILLCLEDQPDLNTKVDWEKRIPGHDQDTIEFHIGLMHEADLVAGPTCSQGGLQRVADPRITWEGYDFLESIREISKWEKVKATIKEKGLDTSIHAIRMVAFKVASNTLSSYLSSRY